MTQLVTRDPSGRKFEDLPAEWRTLRALGLSTRQLRRRWKPDLQLAKAYRGVSDFPPTTSNYAGRLIPPAVTHKNEMLQGYIAGSRPPMALDFVYAYFYPNGPYSDDALPLTQETFEMFNRQMYEYFLNGQMAGKVEYDPPNYQDVEEVLSSHPDLALERIHVPGGSSRSLKRTKVQAFGLPGSHYQPPPPALIVTDANTGNATLRTTRPK